MSAPSDQDRPYWLEIRRLAPAQPAGAAYDQLYTVESLSQIESFYLWLLDRLELPAQGRLLDVSCGAGEVVRLAAGRGLAAVGLDISEVVARVARAHVGQGAAIVVGEGETLPFPDRSFDLVTNIGSLEHFRSPEQGVREMARVLRPGGRAFVLVPNTFSLLTNIWSALRTGRTPADDQPIQRYGARADWTVLLEANGLRPRRVIKYERSWPRTAGDWRHYLRRPRQFLRLLAGPFVPLNLAFCFLFSCERASD